MSDFSWEIRNSGLMLLNSLLRRLNGGTDTNSTKASSANRRLSPLAYERYPNLPGLVASLLLPCGDSFSGPRWQRTSVSDTATAQRVFSALEIIERFGIPKDHYARIRELIDCHMRDPLWPIRDKAAKSFAYAIHEKEIAIEAGQLLQSILLSEGLQNALHGRLLCVRYLLARLGPSLWVTLAGTKDLSATFGVLRAHSAGTVNDRRLEEQILGACDYFMNSNACPITTAAYFNIVADVLESHATCKGASSEDTTLSRLLLVN